MTTQTSAPPPYTPAADSHTTTTTCYQPYPPAQSAGYVQSAQPQPQTVIVVNATGNCPRCRMGNIVDTYTLAGICCAVWFFPCGLICCLSWRIPRCNNCGAVVDH